MDDEEDVRRVIGEMLLKLGYEPGFAREGTEAIALYQHRAAAGLPFAAVIMDLTIPGGMGGQETIKKLIEIDPGASVIVASGYSNDPVMADFESYGFSGVLAKPFTAEVLATVLRECLL
jgi:CheY-like chemotaxis protein